MFKILVALFLVFPLLYGKSNNSILSLKEANKRVGEFDKKLLSISNDIINERKSIVLVTLELKKIEKQLNKDKKIYSKEKRRVLKLQKEFKALFLKQKDLRSKVVTTSAKLISLSVVNSGDKKESLYSIILDEVFDTLNKENVKKLKAFDKGLSKRSLKIDILKKKIDTLKDSIKKVEKKKLLAKKKKTEKQKMYKRLNSKKSEYKQYIRKVIENKKRIKKEIEKAQKKIVIAKKQSKKRVTIKKVGNSYSKDAVRGYKGKKTIPPIKNYKVITKFGTYIDPIYKFKIFSSSVLLKPNKRNSRVRSIFNGRVTLLKEDKTLGKFVMIEHFNGLQTMYAYLDSFSPSIKAGKKIKKGTVIGRVSEKLYFEIMEKNYRINPLEVIE